MERIIKVGMIGCGAVAHKRANALGNCKLVACADRVFEKAHAFASQHPGCVAIQDWRNLLSRDDIDMVIIATHHAALAEITYAAVTAGKHVLVEKPGACSVKELQRVIVAAKKSNVLVRVGFNHRYHPALRQARQLIDENKIGDLMFVRARYGHGGRVGYEKEWRAQPALSGGGELIDQGVHLIDLARWLLGDFPHVEGFANTYFWNMPVDDNAFLLLRTAKNQVAHLHASWTEWKNIFSFEIFGRTGKIEINGLGGSYGIEKLTLHKMLPQMGVPETTTWEYLDPDDSWEMELREFVEDIKLNREPAATLHDALAALKVVERIYQSQKECVT